MSQPSEILPEHPATASRPSSTSSRGDATPKRSWLSIPTPLARLFRRFPLLTYAPNELPARSPINRGVPVLHVFASDEDALRGWPSFNPSCLKWQTFLKLAGVEFHIIPSNNHASPTGSLPFLIPSSGAGDIGLQSTISSNKLEQYALEHGSKRVPDTSSLRMEAYQSLLDHRIRNAWLYSLYLSPANVQLVSDLYLIPVSATTIVRKTVSYQLRQAAEAQILQTAGTTRLEAATLYKAAEQAFAALAVALGTEDWFFGSAEPGLFDTAVFAYTHLLLDSALEWKDTRLRDALVQNSNLVHHRNRLLVKCWPEKQP